MQNEYDAALRPLCDSLRSTKIGGKWPSKKTKCSDFVEFVWTQSSLFTTQDPACTKDDYGHITRKELREILISL